MCGVYTNQHCLSMSLSGPCEHTPNTPHTPNAAEKGWIMSRRNMMDEHLAGKKRSSGSSGPHTHPALSVRSPQGRPSRPPARSLAAQSLCLSTITCVAAGLLLAVTGCSQRQEVQFSDPNAGVVDVMTFNIRNGKANDGVNDWPKRRELLVRVISEHRSDIVCLQEAFDFQVEYIAANMPQYDVYYVGRDDGVRAGESCAILYRRSRYTLAESGTFWFSDTPSKPSNHWGNKCLRICSWVRLVDKTDGKGFHIYNLHLDHISQYSRAKSTRLLAGRISQRQVKDPYVVMGDFNMSMDNPGMRYLQKAGVDTPYPRLVSAWEIMHPREPGLKTAHGFKGDSSGSAIDHILVEEGTTILKSDVDQRAFDGHYPSDHYPVTARIRLCGK
jgi:endonuclease/exonuclease/phosphatase family metal-dependent hydrolase